MYLTLRSMYVPSSTTSLLLMDNFPGHKTDNVLKAFESNRLETLYLALNCTPVIQPLDVGVNHSFKSKVKNMHVKWMINHFNDVVYKKLNSNKKYYRAPSVYQITNWICEGWTQITEETINNSNLLNSCFKIFKVSLHVDFFNFFFSNEGYKPSHKLAKNHTSIKIK